MSAFQIGDKVIFHQNTMTSRAIGINKYMMQYLEEQTVLTVRWVGTGRDGVPTVSCQAPRESHWNYHPEDLKFADNRTKDEIYLDNLLKGVNV